MISASGKPGNFLHLGNRDLWNLLHWLVHVGEIAVGHLSTACYHAKDTEG